MVAAEGCHEGLKAVLDQRLARASAPAPSPRDRGAQISVRPGQLLLGKRVRRFPLPDAGAVLQLASKQPVILGVEPIARDQGRLSSRPRAFNGREEARCVVLAPPSAALLRRLGAAAARLRERASSGDRRLDVGRRRRADRGGRRGWGSEGRRRREHEDSGAAKGGGAGDVGRAAGAAKGGGAGHRAAIKAKGSGSVRGGWSLIGAKGVIAGTIGRGILLQGLDQRQSQRRRGRRTRGGSTWIGRARSAPAARRSRW